MRAARLVTRSPRLSLLHNGRRAAKGDRVRGEFSRTGCPASCYLVKPRGSGCSWTSAAGRSACCSGMRRFWHRRDLPEPPARRSLPGHGLLLGSAAVRPDGPKPAIPVYGPRGTAERLARAGERSRRGPRARFHLPRSEPRAVRGRANATITTDQITIRSKTFGFRVEHDGWRFAYSADTGESAALIGLSRDVDLLLCEAAYLDGRKVVPDVHPPRPQAGRGAGRCRPACSSPTWWPGTTPSGRWPTRPRRSAGRLPRPCPARRLARVCRSGWRCPIGCPACRDPTGDPSMNCVRSS